MKLSPECRVADVLKKEGAYEPLSMEAWQRLCEDGNFDIALDVGAYSGIYAIAAAQIGKHAIALEPRRNLASLVRRNAALNGVDVDVWEVAASDKNGYAQLYWDAKFPMNSTARFNPKPTQKHHERVAIVALDTVTFAGRVGAIKIDVEGHEAMVLRGARRLIQDHKPTLLIETMDHDDRKQAVMDRLPNHRCHGFLDKRNLLMVPV